MAKTLDEKSKEKAYHLYDSSAIKSIEVGTIKGLYQIHKYLFDGLWSFAGKTRSKNISKGNFRFVSAMYLEKILPTIERMPENNFEEIVAKYG